MGNRWEAAFFRRESAELERIAADAVAVAALAADPIQVMLHFMAPEEWAPLVSSELTAFSRKPLPMTASALGAISASIFGHLGLSFRNAEILLAKTISEIASAESLYIYWNDTYNAAGYVAFHGGVVRHFEMAGWEGTPTFVSDDGSGMRTGGLDALLRRGFQHLGWRAPESIEELLEAFYSEHAVTTSYVLVEGRMPVSPPRRR